MLDDPTDIDGFVAALQRLLGDGVLRGNLGASARSHVLRHGLIIRDTLEVLSVAVGEPALASLRHAA